MGKTEITIFIRGGADIGEKRIITNRSTGASQTGTVIKDLINTIKERTTFNDKIIRPSKHYYRVRLD